VTITVEDGTGKSDAESYISVTDADSYHADRGNTSWAALSDADKEAALRRATDYMLQTYRQNWKGRRTTSDQSLDWPRYDVAVDGFEVDSDWVPDAVARACAELALRASAEDLSPDLERGVVRERIDVIEVEYDAASPQAKRYRAIDNLLAPYMTGGKTFARLVRA
jgi:hypothetical protein